MHILVIGGSGMLAQTCKTLANRGTTVSVIGRSKRRLELLEKSMQESAGAINPISLNYQSEQKLLSSIEDASENFGPIELCVCWIHDDVAPDAPYAVAQLLNSQSKKSRFYHVLGSEEGNPARIGDELSNRFRKLANIDYHKVILGFICKNNSSRWLTNEEISQGALDAIKSNQSEYVVGTVTPWSLRP